MAAKGTAPAGRVTKKAATPPEAAPLAPPSDTTVPLEAADAAVTAPPATAPTEPPAAPVAAPQTPPVAVSPPAPAAAADATTMTDTVDVQVAPSTPPGVHPPTPVRVNDQMVQLQRDLEDVKQRLAAARQENTELRALLNDRAYVAAPDISQPRVVTPTNPNTTETQVVDAPPTVLGVRPPGTTPGATSG